MYYRKAAAHGGRFWAKVPLGESRFDVCLRMKQFFGTIHRDAKRHGINTVVIVSHGVTIRAFMTMWLHLSPEWFEVEPNPRNTSIRLIENWCGRQPPGAARNSSHAHRTTASVLMAATCG